MHRRQVGSDAAERLRQIELFEGLSQGELQMVGRLLDELTAEPGEELMREGDHGYEMLVIEEGSAEVIQGGQTIGTMGPGEYFGELALLEVGGRRTATVVAATQLRALLVSAHFVREMRRALPVVADRIAAIAAERERRDRERAMG